MTNSKKSLLSVAAAMAITATSLSADYLPLTTTANDDVWVLFGVNGFKTDGVAAATAGVFSIADNAANALIDPTVDEVEISGFTVGGENFGKIKAISLTAPLEVRVDLTTSAPTWNAEEPVRTIYIDSSGDGAPNFSFEYKASLEGKTLEYSINNGVAYELVINYANTYDNPKAGTAIEGGGGNTGTSLNEILDTDGKSAVDFDFAGNPASVLNYDHDTHRDAKTTGAGPGELRLYSYDAQNQIWKLFDTANTVGTNDFDTLTKSKGYWGKIDTDTGGAVDEEAGLVLGTSDLVASDYTDAGLADGWNLISFDDTNSEIRNASTGIIFTIKAVAGSETMVISDFSRNHSVTITLGAASTTTQAIAKDINSQIAQGIALGTLPYNMKINAFGVSATEVAIISNQKFSIRDTGDDMIGAATTLTTFDATSQSLWNEATNALVDYSGGDVPTTDVTSVYGHSAMIIEPLTGNGHAAALALGATIQVALVSDDTATDEAIAPGAHAITDFVTALDASGSASSVMATGIDLDHDGTNEHILLSATEPFWVRDNTFTRVFTYTDSAVDGTIKITQSGTGIADQTITANARTTATQVSGDINTVGVLSAGTPTADDTKIVFVNDYSNPEYKILETTGDHLTPSSTSDDMAKGAVKGIYSLNYLAKKSKTNIVTMDIDEIADEATDTIGFDFTTVFGTTTIAEDTPTNLGIQAAYTEGNDATVGTCAYFNDVAGLMTTHFTDNAIAATATVTCVNEAGRDAANIAISGPDIISANYLNTNGGTVGDDLPGDEAATADLGYIGTLVADVVSDLKYNTEYSPDYVMDGPLFVLKEAGYDLNALVTGTMDFVNDDVTWSSIDLTRSPSEWLESQDYDLFDTDGQSGYWAYLTTNNTVNPISVSNASLSKNYTHHFNTATTDGLTYNEYSGNLNVEISGIDYTIDEAASARVTASINGKKIELSRSGTTDFYTGKVSLFESGGVSRDISPEIIIDVSNGLGHKYSEALVVGTFDNTKPDAPGVTRNGLDLNITTTETNGVGIYVFENAIPEDGTEAAKIVYTAAAGTVENICQDMTAVSFGDDPTSLKVIVVDGDNTIGTGNASDATSIAYMPILKTRVYVTDSHNGGVPVATGGGADYNSSCETSGAVTVNTGVTLSSVTDGETVRMAYTSLGEELVTSVPNSVYLTDAGTPAVIVKVTYPDNYIGDDIYIELGGQMYDYQLIATPAAGVAGRDSANPIDISGTILTGISF